VDTLGTPCWGEPSTEKLSVSEAYEAYAADLRRYATSRTRDVAGAEDIVQEAFVRLAVESHARRHPKEPRAWLYRVVHNLIVSGSRRAEVARRRSDGLSPDVSIVESPETAILSSERCGVLGSALQAASVAGQTGLLLVAQGYSGREIASALGRSEGATRTLICRARRNVRRELDTLDSALLAG
jgi:RNA polymerase sigma-70 factor, ECF subfamily